MALLTRWRHPVSFTSPRFVRVKQRAVLVAALCAVPFLSILSAAELRTKSVFLITTDGLRWEEVFRGAAAEMLNKEFGNISNTNAVKEAFWRETPEARREALLPFVWGTLAKQGQIWGNRDQQSDVRVSNPHHFSYPGYNEFLTGVADLRIDSNDKNLNANTNVFEWLHSKPAFRGRVAAAINWDVLAWVLNGPRAGFPIWSGFEVPSGTSRFPMPDGFSDIVERSKTVWSGVLLDTFVIAAAKQAVKTLKPRALYVSLGETDDWAHEGDYERYLKAARLYDQTVGELWELVQSMPEYRGTTSFVLTTDHGRGPGPVAWKNHGASIADSAFMWFAVLGPDTAPLGERKSTALVTQSQVASTVAALLGEDFERSFPRAGRVVREVVGVR